MHILLIHQAFSLPQQSGGSRHLEFARHCLRQGDIFTVVAGSVNYHSSKPVAHKTSLAGEGVAPGDPDVLWAYTHPNLHKSYGWRMFSYLSFMLSSFWKAFRVTNVDIVIGTSPPIFQAMAAWLVAALKRRPFVLEVRDLWPDFAISIGVLTNPILISAAKWMERFLYRKAVHIIVNSPAYLDCLVGKGVSRDKLTLIANGVDPDSFDPNCRGENLRNEWGACSKTLVTYAGALGAANDIETILRACLRLRTEDDIEFIIAGDGKERQNLQAFAGRHALPNVRFLGAVPKDMMHDLLGASDICVATLLNIPLFNTTYPNKVFDYMAAGRPTVLAIDGAIRQVIEKAEGGIFVTPGDDRALASAIVYLHLHPQERTRLGASARSYVTAHFNRRHQAEDFHSLLVRVLA